MEFGKERLCIPLQSAPVPTAMQALGTKQTEMLKFQFYRKRIPRQVRSSSERVLSSYGGQIS